LDRPGQLALILTMLPDERDRTGILDPESLKDDVGHKLAELLQGVFGTPEEPKADAADVPGIEDSARDALVNARQQLKLDSKVLAQGSALYRVQCLHCHGLTGNGRGPTAPWVNPHPRDYRQGLFKFTSSNQEAGIRKPRREDLLRTLRSGIEGTSMPSFNLLSDDQLEAIVSYVIHLSLRGQVEFNVMKSFLQSGGEESDVAERFNGNLEAIAGWWVEAQTSVIKPESASPFATEGEQRAESIRNGYRLFRETSAAGCIGCHQDYGRRGAFFYDAWGTIAKPADLTVDVYRGGRRPIDLFWRIHSGVGGSNMPGFSNLLKTKDIWDMVNFVLVLPYANARKQLGIEID
jgi:mono/diheme cytochrome c family protein